MHAWVQTCKWLNYVSRISDSNIFSNYQTGIHETVEAEEDVLNNFYTDLQNEVSRVCKNGILMAIGDSNARVGSGERINYRVMGTYEFWQRNDRGEPLLCNFLCISNTKFKQVKSSRCWTWEFFTSAHTTTLTKFHSAGNSYLASKRADHFLVLI